MKKPQINEASSLASLGDMQYICRCSGYGSILSLHNTSVQEQATGNQNVDTGFSLPELIPSMRLFMEGLTARVIKVHIVGCTEDMI